MTQYLRLDGKYIVSTARTLASRVEERFPYRHLSAIARDLVTLSESTLRLSHDLARPWWRIRIVCCTGLLLLFGAVVGVLASIDLNLAPRGAWEWMAALESAINDLVFIGVAAWFLFSIEERLKRRRALSSLHALRALAHLIDMHQLTKDPERAIDPTPDTKSSPQRGLSPFELSRYLDYCTEMLALVGKLSALLVQDFPEPVVLATVNDLESLTSGLSRKIWQKIDIVCRLTSLTATPRATGDAAGEVEGVEPSGG